MKYAHIAAALVAALMCGAALAQSATPAPEPSTPQTQSPAASSPQQAQPQTQAPTASSPATAENQPGNRSARIAPGSVIPVQLTKTIDAKKAKTGEEVVAKVTQDMKNQTGDVLVPKDTKVIGHVTEAQPRNKEQKESQLGIAFDRAEMKNGNSMQMPMSIQAIIGQQNNNANPGGGNNAGPPQQSTGGGTPSSAGAPSRSGSGMSGSAAPSNTSPATAGETGGNETQTGGSSMPPINGQTQGVIGISNLQLSRANGTQGSVMTSEKNNVKLESGTMLLLKVQ